MRYVTLPHTDLWVSSISMGTVGLGSAIDCDASFALLDAYAEAGGTFVDTAHVYANWTPGEKHRSEKTIGAWLKSTGHRDRMIVATKGGHPDPGASHITRLSPREIVGDLDESLDFLGLETIDLYWLHRDDPNRPVGEMLETLDEQRRLGKIRFVGCSNWKPDRIRAAHAYAAAHGIPSFVASQILWSLADPNPGAVAWDHANMDDEAAAFYPAAGMSVLAFTSQARGFFTKASAGGVASLKEGVRRDYENERNLGRLARAEELAKRLGTSVTAVVLASITSWPFVAIPIIGCQTLDQLRDSLAGADLTLTPEALHYLVDGGA